MLVITCYAQAVKFYQTEIQQAIPFMGCKYHECMHRINESEVKEALKRIKSRKVVDPDGITIEVWRCLGEMDVR